jgi:hypothetical protein
MDFIIGFVLGAFLCYALLVLNRYLKQKTGLKYDDYKRLPFLIKMQDTLRHIVYEFGIKRNNFDFLLNITNKDKVILQAMHRAHFPFLIGEKNERNFGIALYIPTAKLTDFQKQKIKKILNEELENYQREEEPFDYFVIDIGKSIRYGGYLVSRLLKEVFNFELEKDDFDFRLFDEGALPYFEYYG